MRTWLFRWFGFWVLTLWLGPTSRAQDEGLTPAMSQTNGSWQHGDWLQPAEEAKRQTDSGSSFTATAGQTIGDPFSVLSTGSLWQERYGAVYTRRLDSTLSLSCETSAVTLNDGIDSSPFLCESGDDLAQMQKVGLQFQPTTDFILRADLHHSVSSSSVPPAEVMANGESVSAETHLPFHSTLTFGLTSDRVGPDTDTVPLQQVTAYDAQFSQPLGKVPLTAVFKGHYDETDQGNGLLSGTPSLEQSLVWKPGQETTVQAGLRQQRYQNFPGMSSDFNQALFADWSQKVLPTVTWHSYAEVLDSRSNLNVAPEVATTSGANGTPQSSAPGGPSVSSAVPLLAEDKTLTFSTGPSILLQKDLSASFEYSNRWDQNPTPGTVGQEQRVSVSVKGSF